jgi:hypothetical protein
MLRFVGFLGIAWCLLNSPPVAPADAPLAMQALIGRILPSHRVAFLVEEILQCNGRDVFAIEAFQAKDKQRVAELSRIMRGLLDDLDALAATRREFLFGVWIRDACTWGSTSAESDLCEYNARLLLTIWSEPAADIVAIAKRLYAKYQPLSKMLYGEIRFRPREE